VLRPIYLFFFRILGWKVVGDFPPELKKYVVAVAPHTSGWDFPVGLAARSILRMHNTKFLGKNQLFRPPFGWIFRALGGYPVDRSSSHDMVDQVVKIFNDHDQFILGLAPEGTRKKVEKFKTGFYYIAKKANVPIIPVGFDFEKKEVIIGLPFYPTNNIETDMESLYTFYRKVKGKNPELGVS
jgi:1-acyl-sn-glycerol-3-phosphate acyltransferase